MMSALTPQEPAPPGMKAPAASAMKAPAVSPALPMVSQLVRELMQSETQVMGFTRFQPVSICKHGEFKGFHKIIGILIGIIEFDAGIITMGCDPSRKKLNYANKGLEWLGQYANTRPQKGSAAGSMSPFPEKSDAFCNIP
jgi:hypothetical protein